MDHHGVEGGRSVDQRTWKQICKGNSDAMEAIYHQHKDYIYRTCYYILFDHQWAEDLLQETFVTAFQNIKQLQNPAAFRAWITEIAVRKCRKFVSKYTRLHLVQVEDHHSMEDKGIEEIVVTGETIQHVHQVLSEMEYEDRAIVSLYYFNKMKIREIGELLHLPEGTVKWKLHELRKQLKKRFTERKISIMENGGG
jgi:RNA polymerase sigma factor (sigma-70 family)